MKTSLAQRFNHLRNPIGVVGLLLWMASFQLSIWLRDKAWHDLADLTSGYALGFVTAFSGWLVHQFWQGHWSRYVDDYFLFKWLSILMTLSIFLFGLAGFLIELFVDTSSYFNIGFMISGFIMGSCFRPMIDELDHQS